MSVRRSGRAVAAVAVLLSAAVVLAGRYGSPPAEPSAYDAPAVQLQEEFFAFGDNTADVSIRACAAMLRMNASEEARAGSVDRGGDPRFPRSSFGAGGTSSSTYGRCTGTNVVSMGISDLDSDSLPELVAYRGDGTVEIWWNDQGAFLRQELPQLRERIDHEQAAVYGGATSAEVQSRPFRQLRALAISDVDSDLRPDLVLVPSEERPTLMVLRNLGGRLFERVPSVLPVESLPGLPDSVATGDLNGDGTADLIYSIRTTFDQQRDGDIYALRMFLSTGRSPWYEEVTRERVPMSTGEGSAGFALPVRNSLQTQPYQPFAVALGDLDGDGDLDVWAGADQGISRLFENRGGVLADISAAAGIDDSYAGMGARLQDVNGDGLLDIISTEIYWDQVRCDHEATACGDDRAGNRVYLNRGGMRFEEVAEAVGLQDTGYAWGFSSTDLNGDGWPDLFVGVGEMAAAPTDLGWSSSFQRPYLMLGGPEGFSDRTGDVFRQLHMPGTSVMVASADMDGDLRPDLIINGRESSSPHLLLNRTTTGAYATVLIQGSGPGGSPTGGEGAVVEVRTAGRRLQVFTADGWLSNYRVHATHLPLPISTGPGGRAEVTVRFPGGTTVVRTVSDGQRVVIREE